MQYRVHCIRHLVAKKNHRQQLPLVGFVAVTTNREREEWKPKVDMIKVNDIPVTRPAVMIIIILGQCISIWTVQYHNNRTVIYDLLQ